ncbi:unnamed protein product, partial [Ectocarpus sp. 12 AP-2014]
MKQIKQAEKQKKCRDQNGPEAKNKRGRREQTTDKKKCLKRTCSVCTLREHGLIKQEKKRRRVLSYLLLHKFFHARFETLNQKCSRCTVHKKQTRNSSAAVVSSALRKTHELQRKVRVGVPAAKPAYTGRLISCFANAK